MAHALPRHLFNRQAGDVTAVPTGVEGIAASSSIFADPNQATAATDLNFDSSVVPVSATAPQIASETTLAPVTTTSSSSSQADPSGSAAAASAATTKPLAMSTVVGACVGALIGAVALILLGVWFYRRYLQTLKHSARSRAPLSPGGRGDEQRRRTRVEQPWNKLADEEDKWEDMYQTKEVDTAVAPMEKLTMFKKSPSVRTGYTHKSEEAPAFELPHPFAQYHPNLAKDFATDETTAIPRPFMGRANAPPEVSWDGETAVGQNSFLSLRSNEVSGAMSPSLDMAIPTPPAQNSAVPHRWESAEVVQYDEGQTAEVVNMNSNNPFAQEVERRKSTNNPFFNAQSTTRSRSNSVAKSATAKGKERAISMNPFSDENEPLPQPPFIPQHAVTGSSSSVSSNDRAIQSLIAALDVSEEEIQSRLRVASMQPSVYSGMSMYTSGGEDEDVTREFPLPPSVEGGSTHTLRQQ